ncbi:MAG TPA: hypothetical protein V6C58_20275 [Allocoleopsis sp.]
MYFGHVGMRIIILLCGGEKSSQNQDIIKASMGKIMKSVKTLTSDSWLNSLIDSLQDPEEAANYLSVILEDNPEGDQLLKYTLKDIVEAQIKSHNFNEQSTIYYEQLLEIFAQHQEKPIYIFINLLKSMGFKLIITTNDH